MPLTPTFAISSASLIGHVGGKSTKVIDPFLLPSNVLSLIRTRSAGINFCKALFLPDGKLRSHCIRKLPATLQPRSWTEGLLANLWEFPHHLWCYRNAIKHGVTCAEQAIIRRDRIEALVTDRYRHRPHLDHKYQWLYKQSLPSLSSKEIEPSISGFKV